LPEIHCSVHTKEEREERWETQKEESRGQAEWPGET